MGMRRGAWQQDEQRGDAHRTAAGHGLDRAEASLETCVQRAVNLSPALRYFHVRLLRLITVVSLVTSLPFNFGTVCVC